MDFEERKKGFKIGAKYICIDNHLALADQQHPGKGWKEDNVFILDSVSNAMPHRILLWAKEGNGIYSEFAKEVKGKQKLINVKGKLVFKGGQDGIWNWRQSQSN